VFYPKIFREIFRARVLLSKTIMKKKKSSTSPKLDIDVISAAIDEVHKRLESHVLDLQAENARLRQILKRIADWAARPLEDYRHSDYEWGMRTGRCGARDEVRQILKGK
jgi:hypothetical protein